MKQLEVYKNYQESNFEKFNNEFIYLREREDVNGYYEDLFKTLDSIPGVKFIGMEKISEADSLDLDMLKSISIEDSRLELLKARFVLTTEAESKEISLPLFIPKLIDNFFYYLNGNRYYAILQLADKNWYTVRNGIFLKTLLMPLGLKHKYISFVSESGTEYIAKYLMLNVMSKSSSNINSLKSFFPYFFIKYGVEGALKKLDMFDDVHIIDINNVCETEGYEEFSINKAIKVLASTDRMLEDEVFRDKVITLCKTLELNVKKFINIEQEDFWKKKILNSPTSKIERADKTIASIERILDERTKKNLREIPEGEKDSAFDVIKWMVDHYDFIYNIDGVDIYNRRIRLTEYLLFPLLLKWSDIAVRILNSRNVDMKRLETVFSNIRPTFLIKRMMNNELIRYSNVTNAMNLFNVALKWSARGPQSLGANGADINIRYRSIQRSYIGNISLNASSNSDPGVSGSFVPFCKDVKDMFFEKE